MTIDIVTPEFGKTKKPAKDLVISTLMYEYPLTLAKITNSIKRKYHASVTFQGVRKAVNLLVEQSIVIKEGKNYSLSTEWILLMREFVEKLQEMYFSKRKLAKEIHAIGEEIKVFTFDNLIDADQFLNRLITKWFNEKPEGTYLQQCGHAYFMIGNLEEEKRIDDIIKKLKIQFYTLIGGNTPLDKWAEDYFKNQEFFCCTKAKNTQRYFGVYNEYIFQYETPKEITKEIDNIYINAKDFGSFDVTKLIGLLRKKIEIKITIMKNPLVAEQLRDYILSHFKKGRNFN